MFKILHFQAVGVLLLLPALASAVVVTITTSAPLPTAEPQWVDEPAFTSAILNSTNFYRHEHNASDVAWNATLEAYANSYLASDTGCTFAHSGGPYGENLALGYANATASVEAWGDERKDYNFNNPEFSETTGHFTQLVWKDTTTVGCGRKLCQTGWFLACEYWPRGNVIGAFGTEVGKQVSGSAGALLRPASGSLLALMLAIVWVIF
jgi:uncharacterized protein YkwD